MINLKKSAVRWNLDHYIPKKVHGVLSRPIYGTPRQAARLFLKENHEDLKISVSCTSMDTQFRTRSFRASVKVMREARWAKVSATIWPRPSLR